MPETTVTNIGKLGMKPASFAGCAYTLPYATPPTGKIHQFSKSAVTCDNNQP